MICKDGSFDVISISGGGASGNGPMGASTHSNGASTNGHNTLQNRRKSQLITFSSSSCDIKNSLSHEIILVNNSQYTTSSTSNGGGNNNNNNNSNNKTSEISSRTGSISGRRNSNANPRLSYAEEDLLIVTNGIASNGIAGAASSISGSNTGSGSASGSGSGHEADLEDDVFQRRSLEVDDEEEVDFDDEFETHIEGGSSNNANDDSGGGSYEDSHALQSSIGGSNRNSLEKDDDEIDVDVISTDVSCYDQLLGSSCNTRNDDDIATLVGDNERYTKLCKNGSTTTVLNGGGVNVGGGVGVGENCGIIYANPFMDDEGIAESGM